MVASRPLAERLADKLVADPLTGCINWTGWVTPSGYGQIHAGRPKRNRIFSHRAAYLSAHGSIPDGLTIDHLCRNKLCCNPSHLEAVTGGENARRGNYSRPRVSQCCHGHPYTPENTLVVPGGKRCRECKRSGERARRIARRIGCDGPRAASVGALPVGRSKP